MAFMRCLVVCTLCDTIAIFSPISVLSKVLLPALGLPNMFTKPDFIECDLYKYIDYHKHAIEMEEIIKFISCSY